MAGITTKQNDLLARAIVALLPSVPGAAMGRFRFSGPSLCLTGH